MSPGLPAQTGPDVYVFMGAGGSLELDPWCVRANRQQGAEVRDDRQPKHKKGKTADRLGRTGTQPCT